MTTDTPLEYRKAVDVRNPNKFIYARFHGEEGVLLGPFPGGFYFRAPVWLVWYPESVEYESISPKDFDERYVLEDNAPAAMREKFKLIPTYDEWCDMLEGQAETLQ